MSIGIIGVGMVGSAIKRSFNMYNPSCYDPYKGFKDDISKCDLVFVCVPTPTTPKRDQDVSFLFKVLINLKELNFAGVVAIKCTLLPNTIDDLSRAFPMLKLCHNPEFLREKTAYEDFITQKVTLIGIPSWYDQAQVDLIKAEVNKIYDLLKIKCSFMKANESEMAKYMHNVFLATKVVIFNEFFDVCINNKINYDAALNAALSQEKIGSSHTQVAPDGKAGYSGACFPKDVVAFNARFADCKIEVIRKQWSINKKLRGEDQYISMYW